MTSPTAPAGRRLLHPRSVSAFSVWYRQHTPSDRGHTDIDGLWFRRGRLEGLVEHRTNGYVGNEADNRSLNMVRHLAAHLGLNLTVVADWLEGMVDTRHMIWLDFQVRPTPRILAVYQTPGNVSPAKRTPAEMPCEASVLMAAHCMTLELPWRSIEVRPDTGAPVLAEDVTWLVELPSRVAAR